MILDHISHSQIEMWQRCPKQWEFRYVYGLKTPPSGALIEGGCYHETLEHNFKQKVTTEQDLTVEECIDKYSDIWNSRLSTEEYIDWGGMRPGDIKDQGTQLVAVYMEDQSPLVQPVLVEETYISEIAGVKFILRLDLVDVKKIVVDHKTSSKAYTQDDVDKSIQASATAFALGRAILYQNHIAIKGRTPHIQVLKTYRTDVDIAWWCDMATDIVVQMKTGAAPPRPIDAFGKDGWWCSERFCGYWDRCRGELARSYF